VEHPVPPSGYAIGWCLVSYYFHTHQQEGSASLTAIRFVTQSRAKFSEIDPHGHVNSQHYLAYFIDHRFAGLREVLGLGLNQLAKLPVAFYLAKVNIDFIAPLFGDEEFEISSEVQEFKERTCMVTCEMHRRTGEQLATCTLQLACIDKKTRQPVAWPPDLVSRFYQPGGDA
jgi:YbgC/YbaW family acyl-CoA thioester hydrolase